MSYDLFLGVGTWLAYVGILDAFMEPKGITTPAEWRQWCSEVVPLFVSEKFCFATNEPVKGRLQIANYGGKSLKMPSWPFPSLICAISTDR